METKSSIPAKLNPPLNMVHLDRGIPIYRVHIVIYTLAILALIYHRITSIFASSTLVETGLFYSILVSDLIMVFMWASAQAFRWRPMHRQEFPARLPDRLAWPALDVFVCTADMYKEPPMGVVNTVLSLLVLDYPPEKLSVYISDDGGADVTLFAFMEGAKFARHWLPYCRENRIKDRSPEKFFASGSRSGDGDQEDKLKMMYEAMKERVQSAMDKGSVSADIVSSEEYENIFKKWKDFSSKNHPAVVQVLLQSSIDRDITGHVMPNLIYVSRGKHPKSPHNFKAGALNVLVRVSSVLTNAPIILTMDCDMISTDPTSPHRALCYFLDPAISAKLAYVQFPQLFQGLNKNDIYAGELKRVFEINSHGLDGLCGPNYVGTNTFHARLALDGSSLKGVNVRKKIEFKMVLEKAIEVAGCDYEVGTKWGDPIGFRYGSLVEDFNTGYRLQCEGWISVFCDPPEPQFLGEAPKSLNDVLHQCMRWAIGLYEVGFSRYCPLIFGIRKVSLAHRLAYAHYGFWGMTCIPIVAYAVLPQLALINNRLLFPKPSNPWFYLYLYLFLAAYIQDMADFVSYKSTFRRWWCDQRMGLIRGLTAFPMGIIELLFKKLKISTQGFTITSKIMDDEQNKRYNKGFFDFGVDSPFFVILGTVAMLNLCAFTVGMIRNGMVLEVFVAGFGVANFWPVYEAMFLRADSGRIPKGVAARAFVITGVILAVEDALEAAKSAEGKCADSLFNTSTLALTAYNLNNNGHLFTDHPIIGYQDKIQACGGCAFGSEDGLLTACSWDPRVINGILYYQTTISVALDKVKEFILDVKKLRDLKPSALCGLDLHGGILIRYIKASSAYLGKQSDAVEFDITYYRNRDPMTPRLYEDFIEEIEQMALFKYNGLPHWGKNRNVAFDEVMKKYNNSKAFLKVKDRYDPDGLFSSEWSDQILGLDGSVIVKKAGCALEGLCICSDDVHCAPDKGYYCRAGKVYKNARVCTDVNSVENNESIKLDLLNTAVAEN